VKPMIIARRNQDEANANPPLVAILHVASVEFVCHISER